MERYVTTLWDPAPPSKPSQPEDPKAARRITIRRALARPVGARYAHGMCGRYTQFASWREIYEYFNLTGTPRNLEARYNIAPTQDAPVIRLDDAGQRELVMMRWGLMPFWA